MNDRSWLEGAQIRSSFWRKVPIGSTRWGLVDRSSLLWGERQFGRRLGWFVYISHRNSHRSRQAKQVVSSRLEERERDQKDRFVRARSVSKIPTANISQQYRCSTKVFAFVFNCCGFNLHTAIDQQQFDNFTVDLISNMWRRINHIDLSIENIRWRMFAWSSSLKATSASVTTGKPSSSSSWTACLVKEFIFICEETEPSSLPLLWLYSIVNEVISLIRSHRFVRSGELKQLFDWIRSSDRVADGSRVSCTHR